MPPGRKPRRDIGADPNEYNDPKEFQEDNAKLHAEQIKTGMATVKVEINEPEAKKLIDTALNILIARQEAKRTDQLAASIAGLNKALYWLKEAGK